MHIRNILDNIEELPTLPVIAQELTKLINKSNSSISEIEDLVMSDLALSSKLLKLINSPYYGMKNIISVKKSINYLGFNQLRNILNISIFKDFVKLEENLNPKDFWKHSIAVAIMTDMLAIKTQNTYKEYGYISGLLHDVGKVIYLNFYQSDFINITNKASKKKMPLAEEERNYFGFSHDAIGSYIAKEWNLPIEVVEAIGTHHRPENDSSGLGELIFISDSLVRLKKIGNSFNNSPVEIPNTFLKKHDISLEELKVFMKDFKKEYEKYSIILTLL